MAPFTTSSKKEHEVELYSSIVQSMQDITGHELHPQAFEHADWDGDSSVVVFNIIKQKLNLKECHISQSHHLPRLSALLHNSTSYHTFQMRIKQKVEVLQKKRSVEKGDFKGIFPDKQHFWKCIVNQKLVDNVITTNVEFGYLNPNKLSSEIIFGGCDTITESSFEWISGLPYPAELVKHLTMSKILNKDGQLQMLDLSKPLYLPKQYTPYYKLIKDTLRSHGVYQFALDHLHQCVIVDESSEVDDAYQPPSQSKSIVEEIKSMNPSANDKTLANSHKQPSPHDTTGESQPKLSAAQILTDHIPSEEMNQTLLKQLQQHGLDATQVSGSGFNCLINALIQHAAEQYNVATFEEAKTIRDMLTKEMPEMSSMLHADDASAKLVLKLVNDRCCTVVNKVHKVSTIIASSDGPIIYGCTTDERYSSGRHVVIWQLGDHFVSIICKAHQHPQLPKLTSAQLNVLLSVGLIKRRENHSLEISAGFKRTF